jgi:hypothetical protein
MRRLSWWLAWPAGTVRIGVVFLVGVAVVAVVVRYPAVFRELDREAAKNSSLSYSDREIAGGNGLVADQIAAYAARGLIPENETYRIVVGADFAGGSDLTVPYVDSYYRYFLMPRRSAEDAQWIICYECDLARYDGRAEIVWEGSEGIAIARMSS